ncbi:hypothetical protein D0861_08561 [Hortaea werneckii]|uniref:LYR motif-containing protein Cup1-like N-terminal domain-containing protein n=1 Tax=Hortaea werneckii TaxID=91943 RepID=A0A3M7EVD7_HORWE|nr:hypothetical protein D0861_08561 [Hortaea werneckii]
MTPKSKQTQTGGRSRWVLEGFRQYFGFDAASDKSRQASVLTPDQATRSRHLLRALLRECTYLPDSQAGQWVRQYTIGRFREDGFKVWQRREHPTHADYVHRKLQAAQHGLRLLARANDGERRPLLKVLLMTYGRVGRRRRELMGRLLSVRPHQAPGVENTGETAHEGEAFNDTGKTAAETRSTSTKPPGAREVNDGSWTYYVPDFPPQLQALLQSQLKHPPPHLTRPLLRRMAPRLEELNSWKRPMPLNRVKNQTKDWYASTLARVHPPLPTQEWNRLRDLASGAKGEIRVPRRKKVGDAAPAGEEGLLFRLAESPPTDRSRDAHAITPRYMRRMWATVFAQCPVMEWDGESGKWKVTWGEHAIHGLRRTAKERVEG